MSDYLYYFITCFLIGSLPAGELLTRLKTGKSMLLPGTRNTIAPAKMFEILGIPTGIIVCLFDGLKGFLAVYPVAIFFIGPDPYSQYWAISLGGFLTVLGHCNSLFLGFRGGRGLAPTFGVMVTLLPIPAVIALLLGLWLAFWGLSSKPGALSAAGAMPLLSIAWVIFVKPAEIDYLYVVATMSLWTMWEHRDELFSYMGIKNQYQQPQKPVNAEEPADTKANT
ncbi:MAG: glycerol-3-phosphate acyltransferase [Erysipelotrichia bacterium]|nr:glycerol-3-phosphate acyltransferase [Erysipelotrichia bacterium]